jgi:hypothetical protein
MRENIERTLGITTLECQTWTELNSFHLKETRGQNAVLH